MNCQVLTLMTLRDSSSHWCLKSNRYLVRFSNRNTTTSTLRLLRQQASPWFIYSSYSTAGGHPEKIEQPQHQRHADLRSQLPLNHLISPLPSSLQPSITATTGNISPSSLENSDSRVNKQTETKPPRRSSYLRPSIYALFFFAIGTLAGNFVCNIVIPPTLPQPGSHEDDLMIEYLHEQAGKLPLVKSLISDELWTEMDVYKIGTESSINASSVNSNDNAIEMKDQKKLDEDLEIRKKRRLTLGPLAGSRAIGGYQKIFRNLHTGEVINIIWLGAAVSGWPGVTHGGLLATILDETLGRCAMGFLEGNTGVTANLEVNYLKPVLSNGFYIIRTAPAPEEEEIQIKKRSVRKQWVMGSLESTTGMVCVKAKALFVVPKQYKLKN